MITVIYEVLNGRKFQDTWPNTPVYLLPQGEPVEGRINCLMLQKDDEKPLVNRYWRCNQKTTPTDTSITVEESYLSKCKKVEVNGLSINYR